MTRLLLIAYGNPLRRDDGVGWLVAESLRPEFSDSTLTIITSCQVLPEMVTAVSEAAYVFFVDAGMNLLPGDWHEEPLVPVLDATASSMTHHLTPGQLLAMSWILYGTAPTAWMITIGGADFALGEGLSPAVQRACEAVCQHLHGRITALTSVQIR